MFLLLLLAAVLAGLFVRFYNALKSLAESVRSRRANILAVTKKRADLAAQLVNIAESYGAHEKLSHFQVSEDLTTLAGLASANTRADRMISQVTALAQNFPDLKANQTFQQLMRQLETIEGEILGRRETYNQAVERYNAYRVRLPQALVANLCNFAEAPYFDVNPEGLDHIAVFQTGDTEALQHSLRRAGTRGKALALQTAAYARARAETYRADPNGADPNHTNLNRTDLNRTDLNRTDLNRTEPTSAFTHLRNGHHTPPPAPAVMPPEEAAPPQAPTL